MRALFLDRDGTLMVDTGYVRDPADVALLPGAAELLREARRLGFAIIVVSNQSGVARGIVTPAALEAVERRFEELLANEGAAIDAIHFCLHGPDDGCPCRKPGPALLVDAATARGIDLERSIMVGDRESDVLAGKSAGCMAVLLHGPAKSASPPMASTAADESIASLPELLPILRRLARVPSPLRPP
jgi:histidinol-phosphate phosphatase family protein